MYYLLWKPSFHGETSENFVLLKTDANEVIINEFIRNYFREYQVLLTSGDIITNKTYKKNKKHSVKSQKTTTEHMLQWYMNLSNAIEDFKETKKPRKTPLVF